MKKTLALLLSLLLLLSVPVTGVSADETEPEQSPTEEMPQTYTISYYLNGVDTGHEQVYCAGDDITPITTYDNEEGYTFSGWYRDADRKDALPEIMPAYDLVAYGWRTPKVYQITYMLDDMFLNVLDYTFAETIEYLPYTPQKGYVFSGWLLEDGTKAPEKMPAENFTVYGSVKPAAVAVIDGGKYTDITIGDTFDMVISLQAPYLTSLQLADFAFWYVAKDEKTQEVTKTEVDAFMVESMEWLCDGNGSVAVGDRVAEITFEENTDINGQVLRLRLVAEADAQVGMYEVSFSASATTDMGAGSVALNTDVTAASVQIICFAHNFTGGKITANKNNTHSLYCVNGCGVSIQQSCSGGIATCMAKADCMVCGAAYGRKLDHVYDGDPKGNGDGTHSRRCVNGCGTYSTLKINCTYGDAERNIDSETHRMTCTVCKESVNEACYSALPPCMQTAICERCGVEYGDPRQHSFTGNVKKNYDGTHVFLCANGCNEYGGMENCSYEYSNKKDGVHTKTCTICSYSVDEICVSSNTEEKNNKATCEKKAVCDFCDTEYGEILPHSYTGEACYHDDGTHALLCVNGCNKTGEPVTCTPDTWVSDENGNHTAVCTVCKASLQGECEGGSATCEQQALCATCGGAYGDLLVHDYSGEYAPDGNGQHGKLCVNGCNKPGGDKIDCLYGDWVGDGVSAHTKTCVVCNGTESEPCSGGTATCTERAVCSVCNVVYGDVQPHTFPEGEQGFAISKNDGTHTRYCSVCEQNVVLACAYECIPNANGTHLATCKECEYVENNQPCYGGVVTCEAAAICDGCKVAYGDCLPHAYTGAAKDNGDGTHCLQCVNGCEQFGGEKVACEPDQWVSCGDDTHSANCVTCAAKLTGKCRGGTASCEKQAICEICESGYGKGGDHSFKTAYDATHHWGACIGCGLTTPEDDHAFTPWTIVTEMTLEHAGLRRRICTGCGAVFEETISRLFKMGDVDCNGSISAADARLVLRCSVGLATLNDNVKILADVNDDGIINAGDARLILRASVDLEDVSAWKDVNIDAVGNIV